MKAVPLFACAGLLAAFVPAVPVHAAGEDFIRSTIPQKWIDAFIPEDLPALEYASYDDDLAKAEKQVFAGRYKLALITLQSVKPTTPERRAKAAALQGKALAATGRSVEAINVLSDAAVADDPAVQTARAETLADVGQTDVALLLLKDHLKAHPDSLVGHLLLGKVSEQVGDLVAAKEAYDWFVAPPQNFHERWKTNQKAKEFESAENVVTIARALDRWAQLNQKYRDDVKLNDTILNMFVRAVDVLDRGYWPAKTAAAEYFMSHDQNAQAVDELQGSEEQKIVGAMDMNPNDAENWRLVGLIGLEGFNFDAVDKAVEGLRKVNPTSWQADLLEARNFLKERRPQDAFNPINRVLSAQPKNLEALGLLAATYALQLKDDESAKALARVEAIDPDNATAYVEVAEQLGAMRQYPRAAAKYKVAIERAPWWSTPRNGLGLLYTQSGDEAEARATLDEARKLDPFNLATTNYMRLMDDMAAFTQKETAHFIVIYNAAEDPVIPEYFGDYMESVHAEICAEYNTEPKVKTMIEVFPSHDAFSVRTAGSSWIPTVGASTGRVIALVSPRAGEQMGTFNWAQVLRHEYTHTVTLAATDNRIAHWMTEGLAVLEEHTPLRWDWAPMLYKAVKDKELFSLEDLTWAFVRPKKPYHRTLAYAESFWICKYIEETWGHEAILKMLEQFRQGGHQDDVFPSVLGKPIPQFEKDFFAWTEKQVAGWGYDEETSKKYKELTEQADELLKSRQYKEAAEAWEEVIKIRPIDALPHQKLAFLYLPGRLNDPDKAIEHLDALAKVELKNNILAKRISRLYRDMNQFDKAQRYALEAVYIAPYDLSAHQLLQELCEKTNDADGVAREKRAIPVLEKWLAERKVDAGGKARRDENIVQP